MEVHTILINITNIEVYSGIGGLSIASLPEETQKNDTRTMTDFGETGMAPTDFSGLCGVPHEHHEHDSCFKDPFSICCFDLVKNVQHVLVLVLLVQYRDFPREYPIVGW